MDFDQFLREATRLLGLQCRPFRRRGIRRKVERRLGEIGLAHLGDYGRRLEESPEEREALSRILTVTISRFFRDREVFGAIESSVLPAILSRRASGDVKVWSIGCASGEEPYSVVLLWKTRYEKEFPGIRLSVLGTDIDGGLLDRAREGRYRRSSVKEIPEEVLGAFFHEDGVSYRIDPSIRGQVVFQKHDVLREEPFSEMDLVFCRNLAFTYFAKASQTEVLTRIFRGLRPEGYLIIGKDESLPLHYPTLFLPAFPEERIFRPFRGREPSSSPPNGTEQTRREEP